MHGGVVREELQRDDGERRDEVVGALGDPHHVVADARELVAAFGADADDRALARADSRLRRRRSHWAMEQQPVQPPDGVAADQLEFAEFGA